MALTCDVVVVGLGPGAEDLAGRLATDGLDVVAVEDSLVGGECPYWGCIPSKMMIRAADLLMEGRRARGIAASSVQLTPDWGLVASRIRTEATDNWDDTVAADRLIGKGARLVRGRGRLSGTRQVTVDAVDGSGVVEVIDARIGVVLGTGTTPAVPNIEGLAGTPYWTNHEAIEADVLPASIAVIGGGPIGLELAQVFSRFGASVTVLEVGQRILAVEEPESSALLAEVFDREGITVRAGVSISSIAYDGAFHVSTDTGVVTAEKLLVATGRRTNLDRLGLDTVGLDQTAHYLTIDEHCKVTDGLWAVGDITGHGQFTHVSMYHSPIAFRSITGRSGPAADYRALPRVTFTDPEVGATGMTEKQARDAGLKVRVGHASIPESSRGFIHKAGNDGFIKVVEDADRGVLVGATSAGPTGGEVMSALLVAVHGEVPVERLRNMIYTYPTFHRAIESAINDLH